MKSVAELKRDASNKRIELKMEKRFGQTEIPARLAGWRKVLGANTTSLFVESSQTGARSQLYLPCASLVEYSDDSLTIYDPGLRELTETEAAAMSEWREIASTEASKTQYYQDAMTDGSTMFYKEKWFYERKKMKYLMGLEWEQGKKFDFDSGKILDNKIKGNVALKYAVRQSA